MRRMATSGRPSAADCRACAACARITISPGRRQIVTHPCHGDSPERADAPHEVDAIGTPSADTGADVTFSRVAVLKRGATLGEMSMLDGEPRYASCWALSEVEAAVITRAGVARLITAHPGVGAKLLVKITQLMAQRLRNTSNQLIKLMQKKA